MEHEIIAYLFKYVSEEVKKAIIESSLILTYKKGTILLKAGDISKESFLVLKACIRSFYMIDGTERITAFYTEEQVVSPISHGKDIPSGHYLEQKIQSQALVLLIWKQIYFKNFRNLIPYAGC